MAKRTRIAEQPKTLGVVNNNELFQITREQFNLQYAENSATVFYVLYKGTLCIVVRKANKLYLANPELNWVNPVHLCKITQVDKIYVKIEPEKPSLWKVLKAFFTDIWNNFTGKYKRKEGNL